MAEPTKADLVNDLEPRIRAVEQTASEAKGALKTVVWLLFVLFPLGFTIVVGVGGWLVQRIWTEQDGLRASVSDLKASSAAQAATITAMDQEITALSVRNRLMNAKYFVGEVTKFDDGRIIINNKSSKKIWQFRITPTTKLIIDGKHVDMKELTWGIQVMVTANDQGEALMIESPVPPLPG